MHDVLFSWIGNTDLKAAEGGDASGKGPVLQAILSGNYHEVHLLNDHAPGRGKAFARWMEAQCGISPRLHTVRLKSPTDFREIYAAATTLLSAEADRTRGVPVRRVYHLSPGTPAMAAVWLLLGKTVYPAALIESSPQAGVREVDVPFDITADYLPALVSETDARAVELALAPVPSTPEFDAIVHHCPQMRRLLLRARRIALHDVPVLLLGESGTGKELLARAIHSGSPRAKEAFVAVNCGAIPSELVESEFFGHRRGAFTGAVADRKGYLEQAAGGTLFLDEVGELPPAAQVKLLRALQTGEIQRVGDARPLRVNVRVLAATNRDLPTEVARGRFREDLFHRLAVGVLTLPPLRERPGDLDALCARIMEEVNGRFSGVPGWRHKVLDASAKKFVRACPWPGNVRELMNTLARAAIWCPAEVIRAEDLREAHTAMPAGNAAPETVLDLPLGGGFSLQDTLTLVARHYLGRSMEEAGGNKTRAAELLGLPSYQTLSNWLQRYGVGDGLAR